MDTLQIQAAVLDIVKSLSPQINLSPIKADQPLRQQVDLDSMDWLNLMIGVEEKFHVSVPEADYGRLCSLDAIVAYLSSSVPGERGASVRSASPDPAGLVRAHTLLDGRQVTVRPIRPADRPIELDFLRHLSSQSRYKRFMGTIAEFSEEKLKYLTQIDYKKHMALVATTPREGGEVEVGVARYVVEPEDSTCEFAIVVDDGWQGSGLAGTLMADLMDAARAAGLSEMEGIVLATNHRMLKFARQLGFTVQRDAEDPHTMRVVRKL
jgi:RimJ/RimL family protein N-acetyltransferase/acyl carrier protein